MKIIFCSKKHYKLLMKQLKTVEVKENSGGIYTGALGGIYGEAFRFEIKPYLKKLKILDTDKFSFKG